MRNLILMLAINGLVASPGLDKAYAIDLAESEVLANPDLDENGVLDPEELELLYQVAQSSKDAPTRVPHGFRIIVTATDATSDIDFNGDGVLDAADLAVVRDKAAYCSEEMSFDLSGDGVVDILDYVFMEAYVRGSDIGILSYDEQHVEWTVLDTPETEKSGGHANRLDGSQGPVSPSPSGCPECQAQISPFSPLLNYVWTSWGTLEVSCDGITFPVQELHTLTINGGRYGGYYYTTPCVREGTHNISYTQSWSSTVQTTMSASIESSVEGIIGFNCSWGATTENVTTSSLTTGFSVTAPTEWQTTVNAKCLMYNVSYTTTLAGGFDDCIAPSPLNINGVIYTPYIDTWTKNKRCWCSCDPVDTDP